MGLASLLLTTVMPCIIGTIFYLIAGHKLIPLWSLQLGEWAHMDSHFD